MPHKYKDPNYYKNWCAKNKEYFKRYRADHRDVIDAQARKSYPKNRDKILARMKRSRQEDPERFKEYSRKWASNHPEQYKAMRRKVYERTKAKGFTAKAAWQRRNKDKVHEYQRKYREKKRALLHI